jgi:hypothetical protein
MKSITIRISTLELRKLTGKASDENKFADTIDFIEATLDNIPQGGFSPKDIRDRNRIQAVLDKYREDKNIDGKSPKPILKLEDNDYENLKSITSISHWASRDKNLQEFLDSFNKEEKS